MGITWELVKNAESRVPPHPTPDPLNQNLHLIPWWFMCVWSSEKHRVKAHVYLRSLVTCLTWHIASRWGQRRLWFQFWVTRKVVVASTKTGSQMGNWFAVGVREKQREVTGFRKEELPCPSVLLIKSIIMRGVPLPVSEGLKNRENGKRGKSKENILGRICVR